MAPISVKKRPGGHEPIKIYNICTIIYMTTFSEFPEVHKIGNGTYILEKSEPAVLILDGDSEKVAHRASNIRTMSRDEDPEFFSTDQDPAQLKKNSGSDSGSDLKSK